MSEWTPPAGMTAANVRTWREFFRKAASGKAGYIATWEDYVILYRAQLGRCYICQRAKGINPDDPRALGSQRLGWDHNHATGVVRGLLCTKGERSCNRIVGNFRDNPEAFARGARYLSNPPALVLAFVEGTMEERARYATIFLGVGTDRATYRGIRGYSAPFMIQNEIQGHA